MGELTELVIPEGTSIPMVSQAVQRGVRNLNPRHRCTVLIERRANGTLYVRAERDVHLEYARTTVEHHVYRGGGALERVAWPQWPQAPGTIGPVIGQHSPWGTIDGIEAWAPGIVNVSTSSHGGVWLSPLRMTMMPLDYVQARYHRGGVSDPWWEEDMDWAYVWHMFRKELAPIAGKLVWTWRRDNPPNDGLTDAERINATVANMLMARLARPVTTA